MSGYEVIEEVKKRANISSDNQLANKINIRRQVISNIKQRDGNMNSEILLDLMKVGQLSIDETKELIKKKKQNGFADLSLMIVTGICSLLILLSIFGEFTTLYTLYAVRKLLKKIQVKLSSVAKRALFHRAVNAQRCQVTAI